MSEAIREGEEQRYPFTPFPRGWFRVAYSDEIAPGQVKALRYFGRDLVLFRTEQGRARVFDAYCPHLGAHLGVGGEVVGEAIRCPFHHWEFDSEGRCQTIPYAKRIPPRAKVPCWSVVERNGLVLVWHDRQGGAPDFEIPELSELEDRDWLPPDVNFWKVKASWLDMNENCVDQAHFKYIHGTLSIPPTSARADGHIHIAESHFRMRIPGGEGDAELVTTEHGPGFQVVRMSGLIDSLLMNTATPIDEDYTDVSFAYTVKTEGDTQKSHLAEAIIKDLKQQFDHDKPIWENKKYWTRPALCEGDGPLATYRKWYAQFV
ncbi:MAG: Rieske 2Fe-2S domain-containing protein [Deltaproteobacteria bacterium]|nr:Rieske 2Fe-2S domain-containing protein [Deltaproteobacteria bacterium]MBW2419851.1 Rieske 2Fe-2S domain-containing protein [Deltaproteobacteria bacterium]